MVHWGDWVTVKMDNTELVMEPSAEIQNQLMNFPEEILVSICKWLSLSDVFRYRGVCRRWNTILSSSSFFQMYARLPVASELPFFILLIHNQVHQVWNPNSEVLSCEFRSLLMKSLASLPRGMTIRAVAGGLLLLEDRCNEGDLVLFNPMTRNCRSLRYVDDNIIGPAITVTIAGMDLNTDTCSLQILAKSVQNGDCWAYNVYNFRDSSWQRVCDSLCGSIYEGNPDHNLRDDSRAILHKGLWYHLTYSSLKKGIYLGIGMGPGPLPHVVRVTQSGALECPAPLPVWNAVGQSPQFIRLIELDGRLVLVRGFKKRLHKFVREWTAMIFWQLDEEKQEFVEMMRMPDDMLERLNYASMAHDLDCKVIDDLVCLWVQPMNPTTIDIIMYNVTLNSWCTRKFDIMEDGTPRGLGTNLAGFLFKPNIKFL